MCRSMSDDLWKMSAKTRSIADRRGWGLGIPTNEHVGGERWTDIVSTHGRVDSQRSPLGVACSAGRSAVVSPPPSPSLRRLVTPPPGYVPLTAPPAGNTPPVAQTGVNAMHGAAKSVSARWVRCPVAASVSIRVRTNQISSTAVPVAIVVRVRPVSGRSARTASAASSPIQSRSDNPVMTAISAPPHRPASQMAVVAAPPEIAPPKIPVCRMASAIRKLESVSTSRSRRTKIVMMAIPAPTTTPVSTEFACQGRFARRLRLVNFRVPAQTVSAATIQQLRMVPHVPTTRDPVSVALDCASSAVTIASAPNRPPVAAILASPTCAAPKLGSAPMMDVPAHKLGKMRPVVAAHVVRAKRG